MNLRNLKPLRLVVGLCCLTACSSSRVMINSDPPAANVFYENAETKDRKLLGTTPFETHLSALDLRGAPFFTLLVSKDGYEEGRVLIPDSMPFRALSKINIDMHLKRLQNSSAMTTPAAVWSEAVDLLFDAQKLAMAKEFDAALAKVSTAIKRTGGFHKAYSLQGSINFLKKDFRSSLSSWERAAKLNPQDSEAKRMIVLLRGRMNLSNE